MLFMRGSAIMNAEKQENVMDDMIHAGNFGFMVDRVEHFELQGMKETTEGPCFNFSASLHRGQHQFQSMGK